jgi:hypothetical protein
MKPAFSAKGNELATATGWQNLVVGRDIIQLRYVLIDGRDGLVDLDCLAANMVV